MDGGRAGEDFGDIPARTSGRASSWAEVGERLRLFAGEGGFGRAVHFSLRTDRHSGGGLLQVTTLDASRRELITDGRVVRLDDPIHDLFQGSSMCRWHDLDGGGAGLVELTTGLGIDRDEMGRGGWVVPIRGPGSARGIFAVTSNDGDADSAIAHGRLLEPWLSVFGWEIHGSVVTLLDRAEASASRLPPREVAVLAEAARGLTARETAARLGLSAETVEGYLRSAVRRLDCLNKTHAVAVAVRSGLI